MVPPVESQELPQKQIAVRDDTPFNEDEIRERLTFEEIWLLDDNDNSTFVNQTGLRQLSEIVTTANVTGNATEPVKEENHVFYFAIIDALEIRIVAQNPDDGESDQIEMHYDVVDF